MAELADLIRWILAYSVNGGFFHFLGVWLIVLALGRVFHFLRVTVTRSVKSSEG